MGYPVFVTDIRPETNEVVIGTNEDVFGSMLVADDVNWMAIERPTEPLHLTAKVRYAHQGAPCVVTSEVREDGTEIVKVNFDEPVRAITPGQAVVFYDGDIVVGGGRIL